MVLPSAGHRSRLFAGTRRRAEEASIALISPSNRRRGRLLDLGERDSLGGRTELVFPHDYSFSLTARDAALPDEPVMRRARCRDKLDNRECPVQYSGQ
jgi:hypothetical protein